MVKTSNYFAVFTVMAAMVLMLMVASVASAAPTNDNFADAQTISGEPASVEGTNAGATTETGEGYLGGYKSVWYSWTAPETGMLRLTCSSFYEGQVGVYTGSTLDSLTRVTPDVAPDCYYGEAGAFNVTAGTTYHIRVASYYESYYGNFSLGLEVHTPPPNDDFASAQTIDGQLVSVEGTNLGATREGNDPGSVAGYATSHTVWYRWTAPFSGPVQIDTCTSPDVDNGTLLGVFTGSNLGSLTQRISSSWACSGGGSNVSFNATENATYQILVDGAYRGMGTFTLEVNLAHRINCQRNQIPCKGTDTNDQMFGTRFHDNIQAGGGEDKIYALGANDIAIGGTGNDIINGYKGRDKLYGGYGDDVIYTGGLDEERDYVDCGEGWDTVWRERGKDTFVGCEVVKRYYSGGGGGY